MQDYSSHSAINLTKQLQQFDDTSNDYDYQSMAVIPQEKSRIAVSKIRDRRFKSKHDYTEASEDYNTDGSGMNNSLPPP